MACIYFGCSGEQSKSASSPPSDTIRFNFFSAFPLCMPKQKYSEGLDVLRLDTFKSAIAPDSIYKNFKDNNIFGSEAGKDYFFELYALYFSERLDYTNDSSIINQIIRTYYTLNEINSLLSHGDVGCGHQLTRIPGYAIHDFLNNSLLNSETNSENLDLFLMKTDLRIKFALESDGWYEKKTKERKVWEDELISHYQALLKLINLYN